MAVLPTTYGEKVILRIAGVASKALSLPELGMSKEAEDVVPARDRAAVRRRDHVRPDRLAARRPRCTRRCTCSTSRSAC